MQKTKAILLLGALMMSGAVSADLNTGLVAHWSFDDCTATDGSGNGHDGTIQGSPTCENGIIGKALKFNTATTIDWIDLGTAFPAPKQFTLSAWINVASLPTHSYCHEGTIFAKGSACANNQISYHMSIEGSYDPSFIRQDIGDGSGAYTGVNTKTAAYLYPPKINQWLHLISAYDGQTLSIYGNGKKLSSIQTTIIPQDNGLAAAIGKTLYDSTPTAFSGLLDEIRIYDRALNNTEIAELYNAGSSISGAVKSLAAHTVSCKNKTTGQVVNIAKTKATTYDCEAKGLKINTGEDVSISIEGKAK